MSAVRGKIFGAFEGLIHLDRLDELLELQLEINNGTSQVFSEVVEADETITSVGDKALFELLSDLSTARSGHTLW